jgi:hypothetical protein
MWDMVAAAVSGFVAGLVLNMMVPVGVKKAIVYPTPANAGSIKYQDAAGVCHIPTTSDTECVPGARPIPVQA